MNEKKVQGSCFFWQHVLIFDNEVFAFLFCQVFQGFFYILNYYHFNQNSDI